MVTSTQTLGLPGGAFAEATADWVQQTVDRMIADVDFRIDVAVTNNPEGARAAYEHEYGQDTEANAHQLITRLRFLYGSGNKQPVYRILAGIPWITGKAPMMDQVYDELRELVAANMSQLSKSDDPPTGLNAWGAGLFGAIGALATAATFIGAGQRAREAAAHEQARIAAEREAQRERDAARLARMKQIAKTIGIGAGVLGLLLLLVWLIRK